MTLHTEDAGAWPRWAGTPVYAYCEDCHNPDGNGDGRCDYYATSEDDGQQWYAQHASAHR